MATVLQWAALIVPGIIIAAVTSYITVQLSLKQFYSQKWWERKAETYAKIMDGLFHMRVYRDRVFRVEYEGAKFAPGRIEEYAKRSGNGYAEVEKALSLGAFVISDEAAKSLTTLRKAMDDADNFFEANGDFVQSLEITSDAINKCIDEMRAIARRDLKVR